jgi:hypothetical protein
MARAYPTTPSPTPTITSIDFTTCPSTLSPLTHLLFHRYQLHPPSLPTLKHRVAPPPASDRTRNSRSACAHHQTTETLKQSSRYLIEDPAVTGLFSLFDLSTTTEWSPPTSPTFSTQSRAIPTAIALAAWPIIRLPNTALLARTTTISTSRPRCTHRMLAILLNSNMTTTINLTARAMGTHSSNMQDMKTTDTM